jgi:small-conductance mechanosensitive channel
MTPAELGVDGLLLISKAGLRSRLLTAWDQLVSLATYLLIIAIIFLIARFVSKFLQRRVWRRIPIYEVTPATESLINNTIAIVLYALAFTATLAFLGASWSTLITAFSVSTIAVVFGLQDLLKSILGGAFLIFERPYQVGDRIKVRDNEGEVTEIGVRTTTLLTDDHATVTIPNSLHLGEPFRNLDRETSVSTVIRVIGIDGEITTVGQMIEQVLGNEPAIAGQVAISSNREHSWLERTLQAASNHGFGSARRHQLEDPSTIRARVMLRTNHDASRETEEEAVRRLKEAFPNAVVSIRRSSLITEEGSDVD